MGNLKKRKPILALLLSFITPGLGQIYNGQVKRGIIFYLLLIVTFLIYSFMRLKFYGGILFFVITLSLILFISLDVLINAIKLKQIALKPYNKWYIYLIIFVLSNLAILPLLNWTIKDKIAKAYKIPSITMEPTLLVGDHLIADMKIYRSEKPKRGDIVIFEYPKDPSKDFIKRAIGLEGEKVEIINKKIYINDKLLDDPWGYYESGGSPRDIRDLENFGPALVSKESVFVLGDNRNNSQDSRHYGFVPINKIKGKALYIYWAKNKSRIGTEIK